MDFSPITRWRATILVVWRRIRVLGPVRSFVLSSVCAAVVILPLAVHTISVDQRSILSDLFWPHQLDPFIVFSEFSLAVLPLLLGYYHLGRLGLILSLGLTIPLPWLMAVCAMGCFAWIPMKLGIKEDMPSFWLCTLGYTWCVLLVYMVIFWLHMKVFSSRSVRDAQRKMGLAAASFS